jgi:translation initiation factor 6
MNGVNALGNLIALNDFGGISSPLLSEKMVKELNRFFSLEFIRNEIAKTDVVGSCIVVTNKGFLVNPNTSKKEFELLKKTFKVEGQLGTANYGDPFVANDVLANSKGALVGEQTSGHELIRVDEGLRGNE